MQQKIIFTSTNEPANNNAREIASALDAILRLENRMVGRVVLAGSYAADAELAASLAERYPTLEIEIEA